MTTAIAIPLTTGQWARAQCYAERGWRVVVLHHALPDGSCSCGDPTCPAKSRGKHPIFTGWHVKATTDCDTIAQLARQYPAANIGVQLGKASGLIDVEYDDDQGRIVADQILGNVHTLTYRSGSRSVHRLFRWQAGLPKGAVTKIDGLEIRCGNDSKGAQSVFPPSVHPTGSVYEWIIAPEQADIAPVPPALLTLIANRSGDEEIKDYRKATPSVDDRSLALDALAGISKDRAANYDDWLAVGMALNSVDASDSMRAVWDEWSQSCPDKYQPGACAKRWPSFTPDNGWKIGSLVYWAKQNGWKPAKPRTGKGQTRDGKKCKAMTAIDALALEICEVNYFGQDAGGKLYRYSKGVFRAKAEQFVKAQVKLLLVKQHLAHLWSSKLASEVVEFIRVDSPALPECPRADLVNVENCMVRVQDGVALPHDPKYLSTVQLPVKYDNTATCSNIETFVRTSFPADAYDLAWEIPGVLMVPITWLQKAVLLLGSGGNGKSTWLSLIIRFLGKHNISTVPLHRLEIDKFSVSRLVGKLANICADLPSDHLAGTSTFKALTGGDTLTGEYKFRDSFDVDPYARLVFSANHPPRSADSSSAFFRRWIVVPFDRGFDDAEDEIPRDILDTKLQSPSELSGLLNKAIEGLRRVQKQRRFAEPESVQAAWRDFHATTDPLAVWLDRYTVDDSSAIVVRQTLRVAYNAAVERDGRPAMTDKAFAVAFHKLRPNIDEKQRTIAGRIQWCYIGIGMVSNFDSSHDSQGSQDSPLFPSRTRGGDDTEPAIEEYAQMEDISGNPVNAVNPVNRDDCFHDWVDSQNGDGRTKRTCRLCNKFQGYVR